MDACYDEVDLDADLTWFEGLVFYTIIGVVTVFECFACVGRVVSKLWK